MVRRSSALPVSALPAARRTLRASVPVGRFHRLCAVGALVWLLLTVPAGIVLRPTNPDFAQFYMGGLLVRTGHVEALYPVPTSRLDNPGLNPSSRLRPADAELRRRHGVPDDTRFMLPPPSALLFVPLSLLPYPAAQWLWRLLLILSTWGVAVYAARSYRVMLGRASYVEGLLTVGVVLSPAVIRAIRIENTTPFIALLIGVAIHEVLRRDSPRAAVAILVGGLLKYATGVLVPVLLLLRRCRTLVSLALMGAGVLGVSVAVMGTGPFRVFIADIAPTLERPSGFPGNQSLPGMLFRINGTTRPLPPGVQVALGVARWAAFSVIVLLAFRRRRETPPEARTVFAFTAALLSWLLIFSPICWEHYPIFLCPLWGWVLWEARQSVRTAVLAGTALLLMNLPISIIPVRGFFTHPWRLPEPFNSSQLLGMFLTLLVSLRGLAGPSMTRHGGIRASAAFAFPARRGKPPRSFSSTG